MLLRIKPLRDFLKDDSFANFCITRAEVWIDGRKKVGDSLKSRSSELKENEWTLKDSRVYFQTLAGVMAHRDFSCDFYREK